MNLKELFPRGELKRSVLIPVTVTGIILGIALAITAVYFFVIRDKTFFPSQGGAAFSRELADYDSTLLFESSLSAEASLRKLEKKAAAYEERLSVIKRWRSLIMANPRLYPGYESALKKAIKDFPYSDDLKAIAVEAGFLGENTALSGEYISSLYNHRHAQIILCYHILSGTLADASGAADLPGINILLSADLSRIPDYVKADLLIDDILMRIVRNDTQGLSVLLGNLIAENPQNSRLLRLAAEYFYCFGSPMYAASLFARFGDSSSYARQADSLVLAGEIPAARIILRALASSPVSTAESGRFTPSENILPDVKMRVLYNLAATSETSSEERSWLEMLMENRTADSASSAGLYGLIRYSRLFSTERAVAILEGGQNPILELELFRRKMDVWPPDRWIPEVWLLLGRHSENEDLYRWAAAFFEKQKFFEESAMLLKLQANHSFNGPWIPFHTGLAFIREGRLEEAERSLREALTRAALSGDFSHWLVYANLGRINESRRRIAAAIDNYEAAAVLVDDIQSDVNIQMRLARCYESQGRFAESRAALEYAFGIDPQNLNVRHELGRMGFGSF